MEKSEPSHIFARATPAAFYKYTKADTAQKILRHATLRWSSPIRFNDAFDVQRVLDFGYTEDEVRDEMIEEFSAILGGGAIDPPFSHESVRNAFKFQRDLVTAGQTTYSALAEQARAHFRTEDFEFNPMQEVQSQWELHLPKYRILCMTEVPDSPQMWAYYADEMRGVVLEFVTSTKYPSPLPNMRKVNYSDAPVRLFSKQMFAKEMLGLTRAAFREHFEELQRTKDLSWAHEREWRVVGFAGPESKSDFDDYPFHPSELRRILYGPHISDADRGAIEKLRRRSEWKHVAVANVRIDQKKRAFVIE
jgi:hypothetical protein